jgi:glutamyl-tRNA reductase
MDIVEEEINFFTAWLNTREISPLISSYYDKLGQIQDEELKWALPKLGELDEAQRKIIENLISRVARRVSGKPIERLRDFAQQPQLEQSPVDTFKDLFDL